MAIDMLNINYSLLVAEISNSYCDGNGRHGHVAITPHAVRRKIVRNFSQGEIV